MLAYDLSSDMKVNRTPEPSLGWVAKSIFSHKVIIMTSVIVGAAASTAAYVAITPVYEASTLLLVGQSGGGDDWEAAKRSTEMVSSHARIAESEEVIRNAIQQIGLDRLGIEASTRSGGVGEKIRSLILGLKAEPQKPISPIDSALYQISNAMTVAPESRSNVIKISFKHSDPTIAALFTNTVAQSFIDRQIKLSDKPGALDFFRVQKDRFDAEVERRSSNFEGFIKKQRAYSIVDQRTLLLKRASDIAAALTITRTSLSEKQGQRSALVSQLKLLRPVTLSPFVSSLVDTLGNDDRAGGITRSVPSLGDRNGGGGDPPLLMVRVYQDEMVALFKVNADIKGLHDLVEQQQKEFDTVNAELATLVGNQTEFEKLKREVGLATFNAELYAKRAVAEQIETDLRTAKLSNIKVIQPALVPMQVGFPNVRIFVGAGIILGTIVGVGFALFLETLRTATPGATQAGTTGNRNTRTTAADAAHGTTPTSRRVGRRARQRSPSGSLVAATVPLESTAVTSASLAPTNKTARRVSKPALIGLMCLMLAIAATAVSVNDTPTPDRLLEWARGNWFIAASARG